MHTFKIACMLIIVIILLVSIVSEISGRPETNTVIFDENATFGPVNSIITVNCQPGYYSVGGNCRPIIQTQRE